MASDQELKAVERLKEVLGKQESVESRQNGLQFSPHPGDVLIVTPPKCGTTLVQQIVQSLRSRGDMTFDEICLVIPCLEMALDHGYGDLQKRQPGSIRAFKTHFWRRDCPASGDAKYIYVIRDPVHASTSFYHFMEGWCFEEGTIGVDAFVKGFVLDRNEPATFMQNAGFWHHIASWFPHRLDANVLWLHYEDLVQDSQACIRLIADFLGIELDDELLSITKEQCSLAFMRSHADKYSEHMLKKARNEACGLAPDAGLNNRNQGKVREGPKAQLSAESLQTLQRQWTTILTPVCGHESYAEFRAAINKELGRPFL